MRDDELRDGLDKLLRPALEVRRTLRLLPRLLGPVAHAPEPASSLGFTALGRALARRCRCASGRSWSCTTWPTCRWTGSRTSAAYQSAR